MKFAEDFRRIAREALSGKWFVAVLAGLIAVLLGGSGSEGLEVKINIDAEGANAAFAFAGQPIFSMAGGSHSGLGAVAAGGVMYVAVIALLMAAVYFILGSFVGVGYARFQLDLVDRKEVSFDLLFSYLSIWKTTVAARLLQTLYILLWSLLFVIPGIVAEYSYSMTEYILAEHPDLTASEAISRSKELMAGNRWRLFCLQFSFIGWNLLTALTFGIGNLWLTPYKQAATAAFYREISGTEFIPVDGMAY